MQTFTWRFTVAETADASILATIATTAYCIHLHNIFESFKRSEIAISDEAIVVEEIIGDEYIDQGTNDEVIIEEEIIVEEIIEE